MIREWGGIPCKVTLLEDREFGADTSPVQGGWSAVIASTECIQRANDLLDGMTPRDTAGSGHHVPRRILLNEGYPEVTPEASRSWQVTIKDYSFHTGSLLKALLDYDGTNQDYAPASGTAGQDFPLSGRRVLIVDDNAVNRLVAVGMLKRLGVQVESAADGMEALIKMKQTAYHAVFMDWEMPEMDGLEATRIYRDWERESAQDRPENERHIRILALTANAMIGDREKGLAAGMDGYLSKPLRETELRDALRGS